MKNNIVFVAIVFLSIFVSSCLKKDKIQISMTTNESYNIRIGLSGGAIWGTASIDWGDETIIKTRKLSSLPTDFNHDYSDPSPHTITIVSNNITMLTGLFLSNNQLTSLDVSKYPKLKSLELTENQLINLDLSKNIELARLSCSLNQLTTLNISNNIELTHLVCENNQLTSLDVSNNPKLRSLFIRSNQLSAKALDDLFKTLHSNHTWDFQTIYIGGNPGADSCNQSIATKKGWIVNVN